MRYDLLFETNRFNLSEVKEHFINPCCFGEDLAAWLRGKLREKGIEMSEPDQEDWGWYISGTFKGNDYFVGIGGNADEASDEKNQGEWRIMVEKRRSVWQKLSGKNEMSESDELLQTVREILQAEPGFEKLRFE